MKIKITRTVGGHQVGDTIDLPESQANHLIANGYAIEAKSATVKRRTNPKVDSARTARKTDHDSASGTVEGA